MPDAPLISPVLLYVACALGAVGVVLAMPRRKVAPYVIGAAVGAVAFAVAMVALARGSGLGTAEGPKGLPGGLFYVFALIALGASLRVITHPRPIYSALYFILTIIASTGLYVLLAAEFMAFALVIIYAGAILITYMFVIMLASEGATEAATEGQSAYDRIAREPLVASVAGFALLAALSVMLGGGIRELPVQHAGTGSEVTLMAHRTEEALRGAGLLRPGETISAASIGEEGRINFEAGIIKVTGADGKDRVVPREQWPGTVGLSNTEGIGFELMAANPGAIEIAGVVLLMAMLGAVVLARKKVEMDDRAKADAAERLGRSSELAVEGAFVPPAVGGNQ
ncbi:MAG: NADH-quinone oxidoreductase subunit J [Phycisphaerales bacterium]|nr:NADH-quinone oxidoreductase subunit J [Phycisphaerales bacterium]